MLRRLIIILLHILKLVSDRKGAIASLLSGSVVTYVIVPWVDRCVFIFIVHIWMVIIIYQSFRSWLGSRLVLLFQLLSDFVIFVDLLFNILVVVQSLWPASIRTYTRKEHILVSFLFLVLWLCHHLIQLVFDRIWVKLRIFFNTIHLLVLCLLFPLLSIDLLRLLQLLLLLLLLSTSIRIL